MPLTVLAPCSLSRWEGRASERMPSLPALESLLARAVLERFDAPLERTLASAVGLRDDVPVPMAPLRLAADGRARDAREGWWLAADPVTTSLWTDNVAIDARCDDLSAGEAHALTAALDDAFAEDGLSFVAGSPAHWYVRCAAEPKLETTPLWRALGQPMREALPRGADGTRWRTRLNAAQMVLHGDRTNAERETAGRARVGSIWFWGGGAWPRVERAGVDRVVGGPSWLAIACAESGVRHEPLSHDRSREATGQWAVDDESRTTLVVADDDWERAAVDAGRLLEWDRRIFAPLAAALASGAAAEATLVFGWRNGSVHARCAGATRSPLARMGRWLRGREAGERRSLADVVSALAR